MGKGIYAGTGTGRPGVHSYIVMLIIDLIQRGCVVFKQTQLL